MLCPVYRLWQEHFASSLSTSPLPNIMSALGGSASAAASAAASRAASPQLQPQPRAGTALCDELAAASGALSQSPSLLRAASPSLISLSASLARGEGMAEGERSQSSLEANRPRIRLEVPGSPGSQPGPSPLAASPGAHGALHTTSSIMRGTPAMRTASRMSRRSTADSCGEPDWLASGSGMRSFAASPDPHMQRPAGQAGSGFMAADSEACTPRMQPPVGRTISMVGRVAEELANSPLRRMQDEVSRSPSRLAASISNKLVFDFRDVEAIEQASVIRYGLDAAALDVPAHGHGAQRSTSDPQAAVLAGGAQGAAQPDMDAILADAGADARMPSRLSFHHSASASASASGASAGVMSRATSASDAVTSWQLLLVQEYCEKGSLRQVLDSGAMHKGPNQPFLTAILQVAIDIASGLAHLHSRNIIHGE